MRNGARYRADDSSTIFFRIAVGPYRHQPADIVVHPFLTAHDALALEAHLHGRAVSARAAQCERPSGAAYGAGEQRFRRIGDHQIAATEFELVEVLIDVGIVEQAAIGPRSDEGIVAHCRCPLRMKCARESMTCSIGFSVGAASSHTTFHGSRSET